jgi:hypothetical protein
MGLYLVVGLLYLMLFYRIIEQGPDTASADAAIGALGTGGATAAARSAP